MISNRYELFERDGEKYFLDTVTGEILESTSVPIGSRWLTPAMQEARMNYAKESVNRMLRRDKNKELGEFFFVKQNNELNNIPPDSLGRLVYLMTYMDYSGNLTITQRTPMKKSDLKSILKISKSTAWRFWNDVSGKYVIEADGTLKISNEDILRGELSKKGILYQKFYIKSIRATYEAIKTSKHKYLGFIYAIIPFVNHEYNIICHNPNEKDLDNIEPMSIKEFCDVVGLDNTHFNRLREIYSQIIFNVNGVEQYFLSFVSSNLDTRNTKIFVNPRVLYCGSNYENVEILGAFCKK